MGLSCLNSTLQGKEQEVGEEDTDEPTKREVTDESNEQTLRRTRYHTRHKACVKEWSQKLLRIFIMKDSATIVGTAVCIAVTVKHTYFCIYS